MTILFKDDWLKYPNAIIDTETKNKSFVRLAALYRDMSVANHTFPLALYNPRLQGVDPFDPNLTIETCLEIAIECKLNPWYYFREIARDPNGSPDEPIQFKANRGNIASFWLFFNHITHILIQPRQTGKSFGTDTLSDYLLCIRCVNTDINLLTKDDTLRSANLERLKDIELELPYYLKQRNKNDIGNTEELTVKSLGNRYRGHLPNRSPKLALNVGRGLTSPIFHIDEAAFLANISISLPAALAGGTAARELAKKREDPYGVIITTTAGKKDDNDGRYVYSMLSDAAIWSEKFFDSTSEEDLKLIIRKNSPSGDLIVNCSFNHRQLGKTDEWLREAIEAARAKGDDALRDFLCVWTSGSQSSPLPISITEIINNSKMVDCYTEISRPYGYITRWYIPEHSIKARMASSKFVLGSDTSDASGGDDISLVMRDIRTGEVVAAGNYNETNLITFAEWLCILLETYPNITLILERRSSGATILDYLLLMLPARNIDPFTRLYNKAVQEADEYKDRYKEISKPLHNRSSDVYVRYKKLFGFATSGTGVTSRSDLYSNVLINAAKMCGDSVRDIKLVSQVLSLVIKNGRVDHPDGGKDDMVIAWLLGQFILMHGKNLSHYGIDSKEILINNKQTITDNNPITIYNKQQSSYNRHKIEQLVEEIKNEPDDYLVYSLERELRLLMSKLDDSDKQTISVDDLIANIKEYRKVNNRRRKYFN